MNKYFTTPIYYVNDQPHIGHAYTTVIADVLTRYYRLFGAPTFFLTGVDEHGQKVEAAALKRGVSPQQHCDEMVENFKAIWRELDILPDVFYRTTDPNHIQVVQQSLQMLFDKGDIYVGEYEGWYSVGEEIFLTEKELVDGKSPLGHEVQKVKERNYFFRMSKYKQPLLDHIHSHPEFIQPETRRREVLGFLEKPLNDLNISRPKSRLKWGIELPFDREFVTYVWFDALMNYAVAVGALQAERLNEFQHWWVPPQGSPTHLIGKDILTTHCVYWPTMCMGLGLPLPHSIFAHGWWLTPSGEKMSKSKGSVVKPLDMKDVVGVDSLRYFLVRDVHFGNDAQFSYELVVQRVNSELANNLGNLLNRTTNLIEKFFAGQAPPATSEHPLTQKLKTEALGLAQKVKSDIEEMAPQRAVGCVVDLLNHANRYLEEMAPWKLAKTDLTLAGESLRSALECLRISAILLRPVMPNKMSLMLKLLGHDLEADFSSAERWGEEPLMTPITKSPALFPRVELEANG